MPQISAPGTSCTSRFANLQLRDGGALERIKIRREFISVTPYPGSEESPYLRKEERFEFDGF